MKGFRLKCNDDVTPLLKKITAKILVFRIKIRIQIQLGM